MRGVECRTDHSIRSVLSLHIAPVQRRKSKRIRTKFDTVRLEQAAAKERYQFHLENTVSAHGPPTGDSTVSGNRSRTWWRRLPSSPSAQRSAHTRTGSMRTTMPLLSSWMKDVQRPLSPPSTCRAKHQREPRNMQDAWWDNKADEVQRFADANNSKEFFSALKAVYGPQKPTTPPPPPRYLSPTELPYF